MDVEKTMQFLLEQQAASQARFDAAMTQITESQARAQEEMADMRSYMRRAVHLAVQEARAERRRRRKADEELAVLQAETERKLQRLIDQSSSHLNLNGLLALEIGLGQSDVLCQLLAQKNYHDIRAKKDYSGIARFLLASYG